MGFNKQKMAQLNKSRVLDLIRTSSPINRAEIAKLTELSIPTVMRMTEEMENAGLIRSLGRGESTGGKPPEMLEFVPDAYYVIGTDIGRKRVKSVIMDMNAAILYEESMDTLGTEAAYGFLDRVAGMISQLIEKSRIPKNRFLGLGIGMPGLLDLEKGTVVFSPNFGWKDVNLVVRFEERLHMPVLLENANRALALGEKWFGISKAYKEVLTVNLGFGIGAAIIEDNHLIRGSFGNNGEFGHMVLKKDGPLCSCGNYGCLESLSSGYAISKKAKEEIIIHKRESSIPSYVGGDFEKIEAVHVFEAARNGDKLAEDILDEAITYLGIGLANCSNLLDPDMIVLSGGLTKASDYFMKSLVAVFKDYCMKTTEEHVKIRIGSLKEDGTAIGAATLVLQSFMEKGGIIS